jgi:uncharacterized membrane protein YeaQ/YmgE (transglycosylase-associated protein family)
MLKRLKVYRTFLLGIIIGLFYAVIVSEKAAEIPIPAWLDLVEQRVLVLTFSGILGGVLYTIMVDGVVELPRFKEDESGFEAGLLGDLLLGIAGAFIIEFLTAQRPSPEESSYITYAAKGIIGGYGSKAIMNLALNKFLSRFEKLEAEKIVAQEQAKELESKKKVVEKQAEVLKQRLLEGSQLIDTLNEHIKYGVSEPRLHELREGIQQASPKVREQVFELTQEFRSMSSRADEFRDRTKRTIDVFEALVKADPDNYRYYAQLAFAHKDSHSPNLDKALFHLNQAIALRGDDIRSSTWKYELNRAIVNIERNRTGAGQFNDDPVQRDKIIRDLLSVAQVYPLDSILNDARQKNIPNPLVEWLIDQQAWLESNPQTQTLFNRVKEQLNDARFKSSASSSTDSGLPTPTSEPSPSSSLDEIPPKSTNGKSVVVEPTSPPRSTHDENGGAIATPTPSPQPLDGSSPPVETPQELPKAAAGEDVKESTNGAIATETPDQADTDETLGDSSQTPIPDQSKPDPWSIVLANVPTTGASSQTAQQDSLNFDGILASHQLARKDLPRVQKILDRFYRAAAKYDLSPAILAAIASRESRCGSALDLHGYGDHGNAFGIMQIDKRHHTPAGLGGDPDSQVHIDQATEIIADNLRKVREKHPDWEDAYILKGAIAAYNFGVGNVRTKEGIDAGTTGNDYGSDVIARAKFFSEQLNLSPTLPTIDDNRQTGKPYIVGSVALSQLNDYEAKWVQEQLHRGGYYTNKIDGKVGTHTLTAFKQFKADYHLEYPELIGHTTINLLEALEVQEPESDLQLSPNFRLSELIRSETASRYRIDNYPHDDDIIENLKALCHNILEPVRSHFGQPITPSSGYRCPEVNRRINGSSSSQHMRGEAVDFIVPGATIPEVCEWIRNNLDFDQLIMEYYKPQTNRGWVHCSYKRTGHNRKHFFKIPKH